MGLAVVQAVVRDHGGVIHLVSAPGQGTTFEILLPCAGATADTGGADLARDAGDEMPPASATVLVVEDEVVLRNAVSRILRKRGFTVIEAKDGTAALDLIRDHKEVIDLMLLDLTLPGMSSRDVFEQARKLRPDIKVVLTSAYSREAADASFAGQPVERFIRKPFRLEDLMSLLRDSRTGTAEGSSR